MTNLQKWRANNMPTNRQVYFSAVKQGVPREIVNFALQEVNDYTFFDLVEHYDDEVIDYQSFVDSMNYYLGGGMIEYFFHKAYFLSQPFYVNKNVLIPRQETEQLVLDTIFKIKQMYGEQPIVIADVCTGSGVIGLSIAKELRNNTYYLTDIDKEAIRVCKINRHDIDSPNINILKGDMLTPLIDGEIKLDVLVCNPPYISNEKTIDKKTWDNEPHIALLAKPATKFYEKILSNYQKVMNRHFLMAFEIGEDMEKPLRDLVKKYCPNATCSFEQDIYGKMRFLFIKQQ